MVVWRMPLVMLIGSGEGDWFLEELRLRERFLLVFLGRCFRYFCRAAALSTSSRIRSRYELG